MARIPNQAGKLHFKHLPSGNLLAERGGETIEFVALPRTDRWIHPFKYNGSLRHTKSRNVVAKWADELFSMTRIAWNFNHNT